MCSVLSIPSGWDVGSWRSSPADRSSWARRRCDRSSACRAIAEERIAAWSSASDSATRRAAWSTAAFRRALRDEERIRSSGAGSTHHAIASARSGLPDQLPDHPQQLLEIEGLEEIAVPTPEGMLLLGPLQVLLRRGNQDDGDLPCRGFLPQLGQ